MAEFALTSLEHSYYSPRLRRRGGWRRFAMIAIISASTRQRLKHGGGDDLIARLVVVGETTKWEERERIFLRSEGRFDVDDRNL